MGKVPANLPFAQRPNKTKGKTSAKKGSGRVGFSQGPKVGKAKASTSANASFEQPNHGGSAPMPKYADKSKVVQKKAGGKVKQPQIAPKITSLDSIKSYRKQKYGV